jgi:cellulose synthase (UDP-forming)
MRRPARSENPPAEGLAWPQVVVVVAYLVVAVWYLSWRPSTFNHDAPVFSWTVYGAELFGCLIALLNLFMVWRLSVREPPPAESGHLVDVFVTTYNEPVEMLRRTLVAATRIEYPHQTWLLDDGNRPEMRALAGELEVNYLARTDNLHAKAGNLNNALSHARGEFVAVFDADHVPSRHFLNRTLGYFRDADVACVSTPQDFYNVDSFQHRSRPDSRLVWNEQSLFFRVIQRGKDAHNAAFFCGTCGVLRREALDEIGGFAVDTVTEDLDTSLRIHQRGWRTVYHAESLAFGLAPADIVPFIKQRMRWGQGAMQVMRRHGFIVFARGLTLAQKLSYLGSTITYLEGWQKLVFYAAPVIVLLTGTMPVDYVSWDFLLRFIPYYLLTFWMFEETSRGYGRSLQVESYNMARYAAFMWATTAIFREKLRFKVTQKTRSRQTPQASRRFMLPQTLVFGLNAVAVPVGLLLYAMGRSDLPAGAVFANVFWACVNASLASVVIGFARRIGSFRRREYRFPIPLPAILDGEGSHPQAGILDDVSGDGFKYYGVFPDGLTVGDTIRGEIALPSGPLRFRARVRALFGSDKDQDTRALGCEFDWEKPGDGDELLAFLYGSDLQWKLNDFAERARTPLDRLGRWFGGRSTEEAGQPSRWASVLIRTLDGQGEARVGVLSVAGDPAQPRTLVAFRRIGAREQLHMFVSTRAGTRDLSGSAVLFDAVVSNGTPLYLYRFQTAESPRTSGLVVA